MRQHHTLRRVGGTGRELQNRQRLASGFHRTPSAGVVARQGVGENPAQSIELRHLQRVQPPCAKKLVGGQNGRHLRMGDDGLQSDHGPVRARRISRDRNHARIQATEKSGDKIEPWRIAQKRAATRLNLFLKQGADSSSPSIQLPVGQRGRRVFVTRNKGVQKLTRLL